MVCFWQGTILLSRKIGKFGLRPVDLALRELKSDNNMDELIQRIARALGAGATLEQIRESIDDKFVPDEMFFLAFKSAELLLKWEAEHEIEMKRRPLPFGRKP
jgi:hypothetical protein